jgi:hypothetical protein
VTTKPVDADDHAGVDLAKTGRTSSPPADVRLDAVAAAAGVRRGSVGA